MNRNSVLALAVGLACGGTAFLLLYRQAAEVEKRSTPVEVLVATRFLPAGGFLDAGGVAKKTVPEAYVGPGAIRDPREVEGLAALAPISAGEQILSNKFGLGEASLAQALDKGRRAYTLAVDETSGLGGLLKPGDRVDVLTRVDSGKREVTAFLFQDLAVLAVGRRLAAAPTDPSGRDAADPPGSGYGTVTLSVTPEQAETLMFLEGRPLRLVLRGAGDDAIAEVAAQSEAEILARLGRFTPPSRRKVEVVNDAARQGE